jgi:arabinose-5-phosphate isomerase
MNKMTNLDDHKAITERLSPDMTRSKSPKGGMIASALNTLELELEGIKAVADALRNEGVDGLGENFQRAVNAIDQARMAKGRVILAGIGKSGLIGRKLAATLASTGCPAFFVHPSEASHGDLGMITGDDVILALSWSGETAELSPVIEYAGRFNVLLIAISSNGNSALARAASISLVLPKSKEACPHGLAPTTSTTMQLALGDALAIALLEHRGFSASDFKRFHPGGALGASLAYVRDLMHEGDAMPLVGSNMKMSEALPIMSAKSFGCLGVMDENDKLVGVITDGDLRRNMSPRLIEMKTKEVMTENPLTIAPDALASKALEIINSRNITTLFAVEDKRPVGILHLHDLLRSKIV